MYFLFYTIAVSASMALLIIFNYRQTAIWKIVLYAAWVYIFGIYGSRLLAILENHLIRKISFRNILSNESGLTFYGGYIPILAITLLFIKHAAISKEDYIRKLSAFVIAFHLGYAIGRLGCHFSADGCYGNITSSKLGVHYTWGIKPTLFPVYPTPLFETMINTLLFVLFLIGFRLKQYHSIIRLSFILFPLSRFLIEFIRNNDILALGLTLNQFISIVLLLVQPLLFFFIQKNIRYENNLCDSLKSV